MFLAPDTAGGYARSLRDGNGGAAVKGNLRRNRNEIARNIRHALIRVAKPEAADKMPPNPAPHDP